MSVLELINSKASYFVLAQVGLLAGIGGSVHCVGMCGGLVLASSKTFLENLQYQFGRLLGYLFLAMIIGFSGQALENFLPPILREIIAVGMGFLLIYFGFLALKGKSFHLPAVVAKKLSRLSIKLPKSSFYIGLGSIFLPCGLLYTILASLIILHDPLKAMLVITLFWMGSVPAISLLPQILRKSVEQFGVKLSTFNGVLFIAVGIFSIFLKFYPMMHSSSAHSCH